MNYPPLGEHWIIVSDDQMLDELTRRLANQIAIQLNADLVRILTETSENLQTLGLKLQVLIDQLKEYGVLVQREPEDEGPIN